MSYIAQNVINILCYVAQFYGLLFAPPVKLLINER